MPRIIVGNSGRASLTEAKLRDYDYNYPDKLDFKPGSTLHDTTVDRIIELATFSQDHISSQFGRWRKIDDVLTAYIHIDDYEKKVKAYDPRKPVSIVFPYSYGIMDALLTYMSMAFIREPILKYEGVSGKDYSGAVLLEAVINNQCIRSKVALRLHTLFRDSFAYSRGYAIPSWEVITGKKSIIREETSVIGGATSTSPRRVRENTVLFEGNRLYNVNPYLALPDPNVAAADVQDGEFFGWLETTNLLALLSDEYGSDDMFNAQYLRHVNNTTSQFMTAEAVSANSGREKNVRVDDTGITKPLETLAMYVNLIPAEWDLGDSEYPEKWLFRIAADTILIQATKLDFDHNKFPIVVSAPDDDGRSPTPVSRLETLYGLQEVGDWLFNSHMMNVRKSINNMLIVDPNMVNMKDLRDPGPGKLIRLRRPAWGRGVENVIKQLKIDDITKGNIGETSYIQSAMQTAAGTDSSMMGNLRQGGPDRLTKAEFQGTRGAATSRLERIAMIISLQAMQDLGYFFASNTQQFMTEDTYVKIAEGTEEDLAKDLNVDQGRVRASYADLLVDYDVVVRDGSIPGGNFSESWVTLFTTLSNNPEIASEFDMTRIFSHIARNLGAKNVDDFLKSGGPNVQTMGDEAAMEQAAAGNLVPVTGEALGNG